MASHSARPTASDATGSVASKPAANANWSWDGGTAITVAAGDTIDTIARRYGVPASAIIQANDISAPASIRPGQRLVIPRYQQSRVASATPASASGAARAGQPGRQSRTFTWWRPAIP